jgi:Protein of unknown function (DUF4244)
MQSTASIAAPHSLARTGSARLVGAPDCAVDLAVEPANGASDDLAKNLAGDRGAATAEYAIATMAAVGFASLLVVIMQSDEVRGILTDLVRTALTVGG